MQVITAMIWRRRCEILLAQRAVFVDHLFTSLLVSGYTLFKQAPVKGKCEWSTTVDRFVTGRGGRGGRQSKSEFLKDVDVVYVPMNWGNAHWVGLVINIRFASIEIYDSFTSLSDTDAAVDRYMEPVSVSLPWVMKRYLPVELHNSIPTSP